jgi:hypothetical protein
MTTPSDIGRAITESIQFISRLGAECEHLANMIKEQLSRLLLVPEVAKRYRAEGKWADSYERDDIDWTLTDLGFSLPLVIKPKRSVGTYLVVQISLSGLGIDALDNNEPLLHIGLWDDPLDFDSIKMGFPLDLDSGYDLALEAERMFVWSSSLGTHDWCYSLRLTDINSPKDIQDLIIKPMQALLLGGSPAQALAGTVVVRYASLGGESGQYRVLPRQ